MISDLAHRSAVGGKKLRDVEREGGGGTVPMARVGGNEREG